MNSLYLWINLGTLLFPLLLSFNSIGHFYKRWKPALISIGIMSAFILSWDIMFTIKGIWGFNEDYLLGFKILYLPIEEWLFFICIPYAFMFLYDQLLILKIKSVLDPFKNYIDYFILIVSIGYLVAGFGNIYTTTISSLVIVLIIIIIKINPPNRGIFYLSYIIILVPFTIVNGILTGYVTPEPIVWYNNTENLNIRFLTIPIEDYLYYFLMYGMSYTIFEKLKKATKW